MIAPQKGRIFISYRRIDTSYAAGRIYDRLAAYFGEDAIFMDVDTIEGGVDFVKVLEDAVQSCDVLIVLIGRQWLNIKDKSGNRRLDNPEDFVRIEIATALERDIRVIPVLVDGIGMPRSTELPENLKPLARRNALQVNHHSFNPDVFRLIEHIESALSAAEESKILKAQAVKAAHEKAEREAAEKVAREKAEKEAAKKAAREKTEREATEKAAREKAAHEKTKREAAEKVEPVPVIPEKDSTKRKFNSKNMSILVALIGLILVLVFGIPPLLNQSESTPEPTLTLTEKVSQEPAPPEINTFIAEPSLTPEDTSTPDLTITPELGIGSDWTRPADGMVMMYVPAGEFLMGSEDGDADERPVHTVFLDAYWIDQTEVTNSKYAICVQDGSCVSPSGSEFGDPIYANHPVIYVSWEDAKGYCEWADAKLPTEAEWEKAARGTNGRTYPWGEDIDNCSYANSYYCNCHYDDNSIGCNPDASPVRWSEIGKSIYGAYDMSGNVWEWVADWYDNEYYASSAASNPVGPTTGDYRVVRGGSWNDSYYVIRSANRKGNLPDSSNFRLGFRCAKDATP